MEDVVSKKIQPLIEPIIVIIKDSMMGKVIDTIRNPFIKGTTYSDDDCALISGGINK